MRSGAVLLFVAQLLGVPAPTTLAQAPAEAPAPGLPAPETWLARPVVDLIGVDKVSGRATALSGPVGRPIRFGTLTVVALSCAVRPPEAAPDAAAFLQIDDARATTRPFRAWMLLSEPALSIYEHPVYDIRLVGCRVG